MPFPRPRCPWKGGVAAGRLPIVARRNADSRPHGDPEQAHDGTRHGSDGGAGQYPQSICCISRDCNVSGRHEAIGQRRAHDAGLHHDRAVARIRPTYPARKCSPVRWVATTPRLGTLACGADPSGPAQTREAWDAAGSAGVDSRSPIRGASIARSNRQINGHGAVDSQIEVCCASRP